MLGLGENRDEILQVMDDLRAADVDFLTNWSIPSAIGKTSSFRKILYSKRV
jgi:hypothetical protein